MIKELTTTAVILLVSAAICFLTALIFIGNSAIDIQLHDTYFVVDKFTTTLFILTPVVLLIFLVKGARENFNRVGSNAGILAGLLLGIYLTTILTHLWNSAWVILLTEAMLAALITHRIYKTNRGRERSQ